MVVKQFGLRFSVLLDSCVQVPADAISNRVVDVKCFAVLMFVYRLLNVLHFITICVNH